MFLEKAYLTSDITRVQLPNGLTVITKEIYPAKVACFNIWVKKGSVDESAGLSGISHFIEHMLFKRTPTRTLGEISRQINSLGGYLNGSTSYNFTNYWVTVPSRYLDVAIDIQTDAVLHPVFDEYDIEKERKVILEELRMGQDTPQNFLFEKLMEQAYSVHPLKRPIVGYEEILNKINKESLQNYYYNNYNPSNMVITVAGDIKSEEVIKYITEVYGGLENKERPVETALPAEPRQRAYIYKEHYSDIRKAYLAMGFHIPTVLHRDIYSLELLSVCLGTGLSSILNVALKEKAMLVNYIYTGLLSGNFPGLFLIEANLEEADIEKVIDGIFAEIGKVKAKLLSKAEIAKSKNVFLSDYIFSQETVEGQAENIGYYEIIGDCMLAETYPKRVLSVTDKDVQKVAADYLNRDNCTVAVYRPKG